MVDMLTMKTTYDFPNLGCLLGMAYQAEVARLTAALTESQLDITAAEYLILRILFSHGKIQQCEISRILGKDKASVNRSIHSLVNKGMIMADTVSYKCSMVSLTEKGLSMKPGLMNIAVKLNSKLSERISPQQMDNLREILALIIK